jgi:NADH-quinone oxidoreductase subunit M
VITLSSIGLPGTNGFVGEFLILIGTFTAKALGTWSIGPFWSIGPWELSKGVTLSVVGATGVILGAVYMLWVYQRVFFGPAGKAAAHGVPDLTVREWFTVAPFLIAIVWIGFNPQPLLSVVKEPVDAFVQRVARPQAPNKILFPIRQRGADATPPPAQDAAPQRPPMARPPPPEARR